MTASIHDGSLPCPLSFWKPRGGQNRLSPPDSSVMFLTQNRTLVTTTKAPDAQGQRDTPLRTTVAPPPLGTTAPGKQDHPSHVQASEGGLGRGVGSAVRAVSISRAWTHASEKPCVTWPLEGSHLSPTASAVVRNSSLVLVTQSCLTLCDPINCSPPGSSFPGKNTRVGSHSFLQKIFPT